MADTTQNFLIESDVPAPPTRRDRNAKRPFRLLEVGQSVAIADPALGPVEKLREARRIRAAAFAYGKANGKRFQVSELPHREGGEDPGFIARVWRIA